MSAPSTGTAISLGQGALAGGAALGLGALVFYGLGLSNEVGAVDKAVAWPEVRDLTILTPMLGTSIRDNKNSSNSVVVCAIMSDP